MNSKQGDGRRGRGRGRRCEDRASWAVVAWGCGALLVGCADLSRGPAGAPADGAGLEVATAGDGGDGGGGGGDALSFAASVRPLLISGCRRCHSDGGEAGDTQLLFTEDAARDYTAVLRFADPAAPAAARLLSKMSGGGHGGGTVYAAGSPEYQTVLRWIQQGAPP